MYSLHRYGVLSSLIMFQLSVSMADVPKYRILQVVPSGIAEAPAVNDSDELAYMGQSTSEGTYIDRMNADGSITRIAVSVPAGTSGLTQGPSINNLGVVSFQHGGLNGFEPAPFQMYAGSGSSLTKVGEGLFVPPHMADISKQSISDDGTVVWQAGSSFFLSNGDGNTIEFSPEAGQSARRATINASGQVAFLTLGPSNSSQLSLRDVDGQTSVLVQSAGTISTLFSINDLGEVVYTVGSDPTIFIATTDAPPQILESVLNANYINGTSINNMGEFAYLAKINNVETLFASVDDFDTTRPVISVGDPFQGSQITQLTFGPMGINDLGHVAFGYHLKDGEDGVALLRVVPESSSVLLVGLVSAFVVVRQRSRRKA